MNEKEKLDVENLLTHINNLEEKMGQFSSVLEKFGLDIITKMGQTNLKINMLTDKVEELHKATIDIKSLNPQLKSVIDNQNKIQDALDLLKSLIANLKSVSSREETIGQAIERDESATNKKEAIIKAFEDLQDNLNTLDDPSIIKKSLDQIKEAIFDFTGGHRILYEISQSITRLEHAKSLTEEYYKEKPNSPLINTFLKEKITFWTNKLMVKD
jgi:DNA repair exonuclease SbcCD ATPase subunit